jgi:7-cyano-7-deazaguanine synthase
MPSMTDSLAIALLSGGLDSATAAALALEAGHRVIGLSFDYGQRHRRELEAARHLAVSLGLDEHHTIAARSYLRRGCSRV